MEDIRKSSKPRAPFLYTNLKDKYGFSCKVSYHNYEHDATDWRERHKWVTYKRKLAGTLALLITDMYHLDTSTKRYIYEHTVFEIQSNKLIIEEVNRKTMRKLLDLVKE